MARRKRKKAMQARSPASPEETRPRIGSAIRKTCRVEKGWWWCDPLCGPQEIDRHNIVFLGARVIGVPQ